MLPPPVQTPLVHTAFYKFTQLAQPEDIAARLRLLISQQPDELMGSILVASEGVNGMLAASAQAVHRIEQAMLHDTAFAGAFEGMAFKRSACTTRPFGKLKVHVKKEIVPLGIDGVDARRTGVNVAPHEWRELIKDPELVLLDNRNSFEFRLGHFEGAVDPGVTNFRDFPAYVRAHAAQWQAQGKRVAMYCTGGIRCEKTSAWMLDMGLQVFQLEGGILNYFEQMPDADVDWRGECFVFDNRVALDTHLQETATTLDDVYGQEADGAWRLARARRLAQASQPPAEAKSEEQP
ncbi:MAG TPA: rhodanese-like domain-containing protein [Ramlibacter sp.]|nr:rhodanese-like domain-containing protein [Ramlibacter sp.]